MLDIRLQETRIYQEAKAEGRQEGHQEGRQEGRQEECRSLILLLLNQRFGTLPETLPERLTQLNLEQLEALAIALLDFSSIVDLEVWLNQCDRR